MELIEFNTSQSKKADGNYLSFYKKTGQILFSSSLTKSLKLYNGRKISFFKDKDSEKDFYLKLDTLNGFTIKANAKGSMRISSLPFTRYFYEEFKDLIPQNKNCWRVKVSTEMHNGYYALITRQIF